MLLMASFSVAAGGGLRHSEWYSGTDHDPLYVILAGWDVCGRESHRSVCHKHTGSVCVRFQPGEKWSRFWGTVPKANRVRKNRNARPFHL